uniref:BTB domain-containing protein n=1 Tax=Sinocyclocheilus rhinocerous TaxID=307959 RepID=A0A673GDM2_9TELE
MCGLYELLYCFDPGFPLSSLDSEDYVFVEARHPNKVLEGLNSLRLNNAFCDVTLCCGGQEFPCHRIVLASFSSYFQVIVIVSRAARL